MGLVQRFAARPHLKVLRHAEQASAEELAEARTRLIELGPEVLPSLIQLVAEGAHHAAVLETMAPLVTDRSVERLVQSLAAAEGPSADFLEKVLAHAVNYDPRQLFDLLETSGSARPRIERALRARSHGMRWESFRALLREPPRERVRIVLSMLESRREPPAVQLVASLLESADAWIRIQALRYLQGGGAESVLPNVAGCLKDKEATVRKTAATALGDLRAKEYLGPLCQTLRDADIQVAGSAIEALVKIGDPAAVRHLIEVLKDESEYARRAAVEVLNEVATTEAIEDLVHSLQDEDWWVRVRAADALGALGGDRVVDAILALVRNDDVFVRRYAIEILNSIPSEKSVPVLLDALHDPDWWVRERAIDAIGKTGDPRGVDALMLQLRADPQVAPLVLGALVKIGEATALTALIECLQYSTEAVREPARNALRELARGATDTEVRRGAARALSQEGEGSEWGRAAGRAANTPNPGAAGPGDVGPLMHPGSAPPRSMVFHAAGATRIERMLPEVDLGARRADGADQHTPLPGAATGAGAPRPPSGVMPRQSGEGPRDGSNDGSRRPPSLRGDRSDLEGGIQVSLLDYPKLPPGTVLLDRYHVVRKIGEGGFGYVYLVLDRSVGEEIILKILGPQISLDESMIKRFVHELKFNRRIVHPNVIRLYDFLELNPGHAISMEYFESEDLGVVLERTGRLEAQWVLGIARQLCLGLKAAHDSGIVHRDIKPPNVLIGAEDRVKLVDFGLAARSDGNLSRVTKSGILVGTPQYMSPEQIRGTEIDARTDIYSLGALLYECLTGAPPYVSSNPVNILMMHVSDPVPLLREKLPDVPPLLEWLVQSCLAKDPNQRPQRIDDILERIERKAA